MRYKNDIVIFDWPLVRHILTQGMYSSVGEWHGAIDMRCTWGGTTIQPVVAVEDGTVNWVQDWDGETITGMQSYGNAVKIQHADYKGQTLETRYAHLSSYVVKNGQQVKAGQLIGYTGSTGNSSADHLHFEVILNGVRRNPLVWLDGDFTTAWTTVYTYGKGEGPAVRPTENQKEENTMEFTSDTLKVGPVSTGDRQTMQDFAAGLKITTTDSGDYILIGPMSAGDRSSVASKASSLGLGCVDYFPPEQPAEQPQATAEVDLSPVLKKLDAQDKTLESISSTLDLILSKLSAAGKAMQ